VSNSNNWQPKLGDKFVRRVRLKAYPLRRVLGIPGLYSVGYGNVGSSIYYALGIVALVALGATPVALALAGILFIFVTLTYAEGTAMLPEAGGSASFARHAFGESAGFISGWALMLSYVVTIAISAYVIPPYLGYFWHPLKESPLVGTVFSMGIIFLLVAMNVIGVRETSFVNVSAAVLDLFVQLLIISLGLLVVFNFDILIHNIKLYWPSPENLIMGIALAAVAYTGVETMSQMAEETKRPGIRVPRALILMTITVLVLFSGVSTIALSAMTPQELAAEWATDPVAGIASAISLAIEPEQIASGLSLGQEATLIVTWLIDGLKKILPALVAILAASILLLATNAGLMGVSRLAFSLGRYNLIPIQLSRVHQRFKTPYISIILFGIVAIVILFPGLFASNVFIDLGALYVFGSLLSFMFAHAAVITLRLRRPDLPRPFRIWWNIKFRNGEIPVTAILGFLGTTIIWIVALYTQPIGRWVGLSWMVIGLVIYVLYRWSKRSPSHQM